jgi:hypothetical protein
MTDNDSRRSAPDQKRSRLRATVALIERELALAPLADALRAAVGDLVQQLALGPEPEYRQCPVCHQVGMSTATTCGRCWNKLTPLPAPGGVVG